MDSVSEEFSFAKELVLHVGQTAQRLRSRGIIRTEKGPHDFVTQADIEVERTIRETIHSKCPEDMFLGEETEGTNGISEGTDQSTSSGAGLWIIDPIDGTANFAAGLDVWGVSVAYARDDVLQFGIVYAPERDEVYTAIRTKGAFLNKKRLELSRSVNTKRSMVMVGRGAGTSIHDHSIMIERLLETGFEYRRFGSSAVGISMVATGTIQAFIQSEMHIWDAAAASLIVSEANGFVLPFMEHPWKPKIGPPVIACHPALSRPIQHLMEP